MKLIVGLGNIGREYDETRHNAGFMTVDRFAEKHAFEFNKQKFDAMIADGIINGEKVILAKPTTYMNESGRSVRQIVDFYKLDPEDVLIVHDDMDLATGRLRLRQKGSAGGHNGIKSIIAHLGTEKFKRLRIGIDQRTEFDVGMNEAVDAIDDWLENDDFMKTMNRFNKR